MTEPHDTGGRLEALVIVVRSLGEAIESLLKVVEMHKARIAKLEAAANFALMP